MVNKIIELLVVTYQASAFKEKGLCQLKPKIINEAMLKYFQ